MKNIRFIAVIALMMMGGMTMKAQDYHPIVEEGKQWNVLFSYPWNPPEPQHKYTDIYKIEGDTLLDGVSYKVMYTTRNEDLMGWSVCGVIRETEDKQVLYRRDGASYDEILYDFSMEVGDTICMCDYGYDGCCMVVIEKGETIVNGEPRQQIVLEYPFGNGEEEVWIEGIGSLYGIVDSGSLFMTGGSTNLLCYYEGGDLIWQNTTPGYNECYMVYPTPPTPPEPHSFAPQGAEWYFNLSSFMGSPISYYHMEVLGDTIIQGHTCSVITQQFYGGNGQEQYVYEDNGKVYWFNQTLGRFTTLYDFDAEVGESWICEVDSCSFEIQVQSVEEETWEGHTYRVQHVYAIGEDGYDNSFFYTGEGTIIEGIGEISGLFPYSGACNGSIYDGQHLNYLRCYLVYGEMLYHQGSYDCDEYGYCWDGTVAESYGGGDGTEENPYKIYTSNQLALLAQQTNNGTGGDAYYKIMDNINLANCDGGIQQWISIGTPEHPFTGHFDGWGNAKVILNLHQTISDGDAQPVGGLFGCTNGAEINNVNLVQCYVHGSAQYAGTLVGYAGLTNISDCSIYDGCAETDNGVAGGLVGFAGYTYGENGTSEETYTIANCVVREAVKVRSSECAGGVVGLVGDLYANTPYDIIDCSMEGTADYFYVQGSTTAGGVVGHIWRGMVRGCTNHQKVIGGDNPGGGCVGGVVGMLDYSEVSDCINYGQVSSAEDVAIVNVGGIVGCSRGFENDSGGNILNCQNYGDVTGTLCCGGIIGSLFSSKPSFVQNCHNHGQVTCNAPWSSGGIVGGSSGAIRVCYIIECSNFGDVVVNHQDEGDAGGILGSVKDIDQEIYILNAFNRGTVSAPQYAGGILGGTMDTRNCTIQNVYNTGEVISGEEIKGAIAFNQQENDHFSDCYWLGLLDNHAGISEGEPLQHSCAFWPTTYYGEWTLDSLQFGHDLVEALNAGVELIENLYPEVGPLNRWGYDVEEINDGFPILVPTNIGDDELEAYCEAPMYFGGSPISDQGTYGAQLWWNKPFASHWFHYDDKPYEGSVYCNYWGIRIPAEEIQSGDVLTHVAFYRAGGQDQTMHYVFAFGFEGETEPDSWDYLPGNSVQVEPGPDEWVMVKLGNPIACEEGKCLWIVLEAPNVEGNNAPYCQTSGNPNACWSSEGNAAGDWMIRGYFINDVGYNDPGYNETLDHYNIYRGSSLEEMEKVAEVGRDEEEYFDTLQHPFGDYYYQLTASYTDGRESMPAKRGDNPQSLDYVYFHVGNISSLGSEWYYEIQNENGSITYQHLQYAADTTINHKDVKIIIRTNTLYDKGEHSEVTREYIYEDFGKVYWWNESIQDFTLLYNLGAQVGDEWVIEVGEESIIMHVDAVEQYEYEGTTYRTLHVSDANNLFSGEIMSGIGHLTSFFPERLMTRDKGYHVTGLRCYWIYGDLVFTVNRGDCDAIYAELHNGLDEPTAIPFAIYPNPTNGVLTIHHSELTTSNASHFDIPHSSFRITNLMGQTVQTGNLNAETQQINVSALPQGMYFISVGEMTRKFVVR